MKIFLTGASGFLGSHIAETLVRQGHTVIALVRKTSDTSLLSSLGVQLVVGSLDRPLSVRSALENTDAIVHAAGLVKAASKEDFRAVNEIGTRHLVEAVLALNKKPKIFVYVSTVAVHDSTRDGDDFCLLPSACHPLTDYGKSKLAGEKVLEKLKGECQTLILRPPVIYGPRDRELLSFFKIIRMGFAPLYGAGKNKLSFCYVTDVVRAVTTLLNHPPASNEIYCVDDGHAHDWRSLMAAFSKTLEKNTLLIPIPPIFFKFAGFCSEVSAKIVRKSVMFNRQKVREMGQSSWICGYTKLYRDTGWKPTVPLAEGIEKTLQFYRENNWLS